MPPEALRRRHHLYAYGTLQVSEVLRQVIGRGVASRPALLEDYARYRLRHRLYPGIVEHRGGRVTGLVYSSIDAHEMERLDAYEGSLYERRALTLWVEGQKIEAQGYVLRSEHRGQLSQDPWNLEAFNREHLAGYLKLVPHGFEKREPT